MTLPRIAWTALLAASCTPSLPASTSRQPIPPPDAVLAILGRAVQLDGVQVTRIQRSTDDAGALSQAGADALGAALQATAADRRNTATRSGVPFRGQLRLDLDPDVASRVLLAALVQARAAGFDDPWLAVDGRDGATTGIALRMVDTQAVAAATSAPRADVPETRTREGYANPVVQLDRRRGYVVQARDEVIDPGGRGLVLPCPTTPCASWPDRELNRLTRRIKLDHPRDRAVVLAPDGAVPVADLVGALDATRDDAVTARGDRTLLDTALLARGAQP